MERKKRGRKRRERKEKKISFGKGTEAKGKEMVEVALKI
jgi:hypothetical protein